MIFQKNLYLYNMLTQKQKNIIVKIFKPYNPTKIGIFGSYGRGDNSSESDIDILYHFEQPISLFEKVTIKDDLEKLLETPVDLVAEGYLHPILKEHILRELQIIYEN